MKIAIVHSFYRSSSPSGENLTVLAQANLLKEFGYDVKIFGVHSDDINFIDKIRLPWNVAFFKGVSLREEIMQFEPDIVHVHNLFPNIGYGWLAKMGIPVIATFHNFRPFCANGLFSRNGHECTDCLNHGSGQAIINSCYRGSKLKTIPLSVATRDSGSHNPLFEICSAIIVLSDHSKSFYEKYTPKPEKIRVVPNFSEKLLPSWEPTRRDYWLYVGRLSHEKGIAELLESWPEGEKLLVYGTGDLENKLRTLHASNPDIEFMGYLNEGKKPDVFNGCIALIFPSLCFETSPLVMSEAFSIGRPILAYSKNVVGMKINQIGGGAVFESFGDLPAAMQRIRENSKSHSMEALKHYEEALSPKSWLHNIQTLYKKFKQ